LQVEPLVLALSAYAYQRGLRYFWPTSSTGSETRLDSVYAARPATRPRFAAIFENKLARTPIGERAGIAGITACYWSDLPFSPGAFRSNALILLPIWMTLLVPGSTVNRALRAPLTGCLRAPLTGSVGAGSPSRV
jgi:hypothetical protein